MHEGVLDRGAILVLLNDVASRLEEGHSAVELVVVGGSFMALKGLRGSTADVDTITTVTEALRSAVQAVALQRNLRPDWLNDRAAGFAPVGLVAEECEVLFEHPRLIALGPPADYVFLMKLQAARAIDHDDMVALWPTCSFTSPEATVSAFDAAYPHEEHDPYLVDYVEEIALAAGR